MKMPFGKYGPDGHHIPIEDIPIDYLEWVWSHTNIRNPRLKSRIARLLGRGSEKSEEYRDHTHSGAARVTPLTDRQRKVCHKIIAAGFRKVALDNHPDHGGTNARMIQVSEAKDLLLRLIR